MEVCPVIVPLTQQAPRPLMPKGLSRRLTPHSGAAELRLFLHRIQQLKAHRGVTLVASGKLLVRFECGLVRQAVLHVGNLIDSRRRDHLARFVNCLAGI